MANFEFDPTPWVPVGFHIIDGGPNHLPRTFVTPSAPMVDAHEGWAIAMVNPPPPEHLLQDSMDQVRNFLLYRDLEIVNSLRWFCGVGAFQFRNPVVRATLVDHGEWPLGAASLRFIKHNEGIGFRTQHGARTGWLMFIGTPMDFRNTETIAEAINTFGEFHYWQHRDIQKCRILVYATFPSPAQVPRDVVFRQPKVARYSGLRHSWMMPVYILSAEMADVHPADEDPMPMDGNPHPLPGNMQPNNVNFVLPEFPEVGWNMPPMEVDPPIQNNDQPMHQGGDDMWEQQVQNSDVLSALSSASVAAPIPHVMAAMDMEPVGAVQAAEVGFHQVANHIPVEAPVDVAAEQVDQVVADLVDNVEVAAAAELDDNVVHAKHDQNDNVPLGVAGAIVPYMAKRYWDKAFNSVEDEQIFADKLPATGTTNCTMSRVTIKLGAVKIIDNLTMPFAQAGLHETQHFTAVALEGTSSGVLKKQTIPVVSGPFAVGKANASVKQKIQRKKKTPVVAPGPRRFTRSQLLLDGHRAPPIPGLTPHPPLLTPEKLMASSDSDDLQHGDNDS
ncbi:hypothetical protein ACQ4PT_015378 [Festuca glaucescens]